MKFTIVLIFGITIQMLGLAQTEAVAQEALPSSWQDYVAFHQNAGALGTFTTEGVTKEMWVGIAPGQKYRNVETSRLSDDGKSIQSSHRMETETGDVISIGSGMQYWDKNSGKVLSCYSGFDQGKLFTGSSELTAMDNETKTIRSIYTETSQGKTTRYKHETSHPSSNEMRVVNQKESGGESWTSVSKRVVELEFAPAPRKVLPRFRRR
ncbi:MAG: hypothetical protein P8J27_01205 [Mariniblastus sp.]|nr:hypothetical protein [Mariniblastus sp.]